MNFEYPFTSETFRNTTNTILEKLLTFDRQIFKRGQIVLNPKG